MCEKIRFNDLNPTFLFCWKGARTRDEVNYHCHSNHIEMSLIVSGSGRYRINDIIYEVSEGDFLIFNPGVYHQALTDGSGNPAVEFFVGFTDIQLEGHKVNCLDITDAPVMHTKGELRQKLLRMSLKMSEENEVLRHGRYFMLKAYLMEILLLIIRELSDPIEPSKGYAFESVSKKYVVERIVSYFENHYNEKISLDRIAENMYLSPYYISKIFKSETGDAPISYLIDIRLSHAMELLKNGSCDSVQQAAQMVGYDDAYHFSKLFKKKYNISPSKVKGKVQE